MVSRRTRLGIVRTPALILLVPAKLTEYDHVRRGLTSRPAVLARAVGWRKAATDGPSGGRGMRNT